jgi:hypothetical protein
MYKAKCILALDINGTTVEGDSIKNDPTCIKLTKHAKNLFSYIQGMREAQRPYIALYTFGADSDCVVNQLKAYDIEFPESNRFFVAKARNGEVWVFNVAKPNIHIDTSTKNPSIRNSFRNVQILHDITMINTYINANSGTFRFKNKLLFKYFVQQLIDNDKGNVIFRSCYEPLNDFFYGRTHKVTTQTLCIKNEIVICNKCKIFQVNLKNPLIIFDDNPQDWDISHGTVIRVNSAETDMLSEYKKIIKVIKKLK